MTDEQKDDSTVTIDEKGILAVRINLRKGNPDDSKVLTYGTLRLAEEHASKFFLFEEMKRRKFQETLQVIKPS